MTTKYLCICDWGQVRSVAMTYFIHELNGFPVKKLQYEAIAMGSVVTSKKTRHYLKKWADVVIDVRKWIPKDLWGNPNHPELRKECEKIWEEINSKKEENKKEKRDENAE